jgi:hypothetical protein
MLLLLLHCWCWDHICRYNIVLWALWVRPSSNSNLRHLLVLTQRLFNFCYVHPHTPDLDLVAATPGDVQDTCTTQHSTAQHSTAQHSTTQHSTAGRQNAEQACVQLWWSNSPRSPIIES